VGKNADKNTIKKQRGNRKSVTKTMGWEINAKKAKNAGYDI